MELKVVQASSGVKQGTISSALMSSVKDSIPLMLSSPWEVVCPGMEMDMKYLKARFALADRGLVFMDSVFLTGLVDLMDYIRDNYSKDITLDDVSRVANISPYYFSKLFKEATGENFIEYLTNVRIEKAKELLEKAELSMKEICAMCGYSDPNYFSRTFKKNVGLTPTEYKEKCSG